MTDPAPPAAQAPEPAPPENYPFWDWLDVAVMAALLLPLFLPFRQPAKHAEPPNAALALLVMFVFYVLWFAVLFGLFRVRYGKPFWRSLAWVRPPRGFLESAAWGPFLAFLAMGLLVVLHPPEAKTPLDELLKDRAALPFVGLFGVTLGPLSEELIFRGFLMPLLVRPFGPTAGILLTASPFAILHGHEYAWNWQPLVVIFLAGVAFGWMRHRTGSTAASTAMHCTYNLVFFAMAMAQQFLLRS